MTTQHKNLLIFLTVTLAATLLLGISIMMIITLAVSSGAYPSTTPIESVETQVGNSETQTIDQTENTITYYRCEPDFDAAGMIYVNGELYTDSRFRVNTDQNFEIIYDGEITSSVECYETPEIDNQSNCGYNYSYKIIDESTIWLDTGAEIIVFNKQFYQ